MTSTLCRIAPLAAALGMAALPAQAEGGIAARAVDWLWPQVQARITVQTAAVSPVTLAPAGEPQAGRGIRGGALLGDVVFARPSFGDFRATSGVVLGTQAGAPMSTALIGSRLAVTLLGSGLSGNGYANGSDAPGAVPYLGLGYSSPALWRQLSVSADFGLVAGRPAGFGGVGRALLGNQGFDSAVRELRLAPMLQLGVRYSF